MENAKLINDKFNKIRIWQRTDGKFGVEDMISGKTNFTYRTIYLAEKIAQAMSDENDMIDKYEEAHS